MLTVLLEKYGTLCSIPWLELSCKSVGELGRVVYACDPSTQRLRQEECKFESSLGYTVTVSQNTHT
jgi:hypothetical protein